MQKTDYIIYQRPQLELKTGIKSSLSKLRAVVALSYCLYKISQGEDECIYSSEIETDGKKSIRINPLKLTEIQKFIGQNQNIETIISGNPLFLAQYEHLHVGLTLLLRLCRIMFVDNHGSASERTGGERYAKKIAFTTNMLTLDLIISTFDEQTQKDSLLSWLNNSPADNQEYESKIKTFLTICIKNTVFKIRTSNSEEKYFQTESLYAQAAKNEFMFEDCHEFVGPTRILRSFLSEKLDPWLTLHSGTLSQNKEKCPTTDFNSFRNLLKNSLDIENTEQLHISSINDVEEPIIKKDYQLSVEMQNFIEALQTKPFLLLAGISGTGKSQKVKELAFRTCPKNGILNTDITTPGNYCLIEVKPNWHDSTELLGYYSNLTEKYSITPFLHFVYKAAITPDVPFFVCLDEMNLAPVEQYFAEYLSVLETRMNKNGKIESAELLSKNLFEGYPENNKYTPDELEVFKYIKQNGLRLPENLFVIGTVNMDDTTHQFSRKVIDRAFTIEMNGDELEDMFKEENTHTLEYSDSPLPFSKLKPKFVKASDALEDPAIEEHRDIIVREVPKRLKAINDILDNTPFKISYRVQNEFVLYLSTLISKQNGDFDINNLINETTLIILLEKILPRVQGDEKLLNTNGGNVFIDLKNFIIKSLPCSDESNVKVEVLDKLDKMDNRLRNTYFANFF